MNVDLAPTVLGIIFFLHGVLLLVLPARMRKQMADLPGGPPFFRFIGLAEVLAAAGLTLPRWSGLLPWLTPLAAAGARQLPLLVPTMPDDPASGPNRIAWSVLRQWRPGAGAGRARLHRPHAIGRRAAHVRADCPTH